MLNLLVAGASRDKAGAERELISLCRKTIIRLIEPPGSETLQPEIPSGRNEAGTILGPRDPVPVPGKAAAPTRRNRAQLRPRSLPGTAPKFGRTFSPE